MYMKPEMFSLLKPIKVFFISCETEIVESFMYHTETWNKQVFDYQISQKWFSSWWVNDSEDAITLPDKRKKKHVIKEN